MYFNDRYDKVCTYEALRKCEKLSMVLQKILTNKAKEIKDLSPINPDSLEPSGNDFLSAIKNHKPAIIAELKAQSPSEGVIDRDYDPAKIATEYAKGGACALSVLTDKVFFNGSFEDIRKVKSAVDLPVLCKEFIIDPLQVYHARAAGADACLLIVRCLDDEKLKQLLDCVESFNMAALVEVFDEKETQRALAAGATLIGVNNRNLDTLEMDMDNIKRLQKIVPDTVTLLSLSGAKNAQDLYDYGTQYDAVLAGTMLMKAQDKIKCLQQAIHHGLNTG
ncbi:indole-3-glycerol phosphate synthase TrpC [Facilibium subflavum]|uniref:indole-3-glycerol phosphate synthase TrpC n=1 Tax=Facilibium subflavum TaxID=2219058 RepID=UPI000E64ECF8|nr:indole-3-glycerol phosphate synthase TrpC [Facilibium subflavum]